MRLAAALVTALAGLLFASAAAIADKRVALVVGNSAYQHVARLDNPANDARLMAETLAGLGFILSGGGPQLDLDDAGFRRAVQAFGRDLQGADVALFFYAGHGLQVRGVNYLIPVGANPVREADVDFQMIDINLVLRQMEGSGTRLNLILLDACRNNPFGGRGLRSAAAGLAAMPPVDGTLISFATQPGNVALDGSGRNSPYTRALTEVIRRPGTGLFDAFNQVGLAVKQATGGAQVPWVSASPISGAFQFAAAPTGLQPEPAPRIEALPEPAPRIEVLPDTGRRTEPAGCADEANARSLESAQSTHVEFRNPTRSPVRVYWLDFQGKRVLYNTLSAGQSYTQQTYVTHPWVVADMAGRCLGLFMPAAARRTVTVR